MDLDPERGQYRLTCSVPVVEANDLRKTLGIRPPPYPVAGALRGVVHVTGPLDQPVFAGEVSPGCRVQWLRCLCTSMSSLLCQLPCLCHWAPKLATDLLPACCDHACF